MLKKTLIGLAVVIVIFAIVVALQPASFRITRSAVINAPAEVVFAQINDFHHWNAWSPWDKLDPNLKRTFEGPTSGIGSKYSWVGNDKIGEGRMTIISSKPNDRIEIQLEFIKPFAATNQADFIFTPTKDGVSVAWGMSGTNNFMAKAFSMVMNMDKMVGGDFEKGLAQLKTVSEAEAKRLKDEAAAKQAAAAAAAAAAPAPSAPVAAIPK